MLLKKCAQGEWTLKELQQHLQYALDVEFWTIPYYMSAMYSIQDQGSDAYQTILAVVNQEMLHAQLVANVASAYCHNPIFSPPDYTHEHKIPHLEFGMNEPDPSKYMVPWESKIGPFDEKRLNTMCLIEFPEWAAKSSEKVEEREENPHNAQYSSIGEFYKQVSVGAEELKDHIVGNRNQINHFQAYYNNFNNMTVIDDGAAGFSQVANMIAAIVDQGEGQTIADLDIAVAFQDTADDPNASWSHFRKFYSLQNQPVPLTFPLQPDGDKKSQKAAQKHLQATFLQFCSTMNDMFSGKPAPDFIKQMILMGAAIQNCWRLGVVPEFPKPTRACGELICH